MFDQKRTLKNTLLQWILLNILEIQTFQRIAKFNMVDFYEMDIMKGIVILVKVDEKYNILKFTSHCLLVKGWTWNWIIKVFAGVCPWMSMRLLRPSFSNGQASSRWYREEIRLQRNTLILQYKWHWSTLVQRSKKIEMDKKITKTYKFYKASNFLWKN